MQFCFLFFFSVYGFSILALDHNPLSTTDTEFPLSLFINQDTAVYEEFFDVSAECPRLVTATGGIVQLDPSYYDYANCRCLPGYYGIPPACNPCPAEANTFCDGGSVLCLRDMYKANGTCTPCPAGATCDGTSVFSQQNYWLFELDNGTFEAYACLEGYCNANNSCSANRNASSPLCGACNSGFYEWARSCVACSTSSLYALVFFWNWAFVIILHLLTRGTQRGDVKLYIFFVQMISMIVYPIGFTDPYLATLNFKVADSMEGYCVASWDYYHKVAMYLFQPLLLLAQLLLTGMVCVTIDNMDV